MAICLYCKKEFNLLDGHGNHCSRSCGQKSGNKKTWHPEEIELIKELVKTKPVPQIVHEWNDIAKEKGWVERSRDAVKIKATRLHKGRGYKNLKTLDNFTFKHLERKLNIAVDRVQRWESLGLEVKRFGIDTHGRSHTNVVSREALTQFARIHPEEFWGISRDALIDILTDKPLARTIFKTINQPTIGRKIAVVDLRNCAVYPSAKNAATVLDLTKNTILHNAKLDFKKGDYHKHNFAQLDYPVWWISREHAEIMHVCAGEILYELHCDYIEIEGYSKQRFLSLSVAIAVRMAISALRIYFKECGEIPQKGDRDLKAIVKRLKNLQYAFQEKFTNLSSNQSFKFIHSTIKAKTAYIFQSRIADKRKVDFYLDEFANEVIEQSAKFFKRHNYLPKQWTPRSPLELAFYWASILSIVLCFKREIGRVSGETKMVHLRVLMAYVFIQKRGLEFASTEYNADYALHQREDESRNLSLFESELMDFIKTRCEVKESNILEAILFGLSQGFSDKEIAIQLCYSKQRYEEYKQKLQLITKEFMGSVVVF